MIKWVINKRYKHSPECFCGYRMKPTDIRKTESEDSWKCIWKKCDWETYQSSNGKLHWLKVEKKLKKALTLTQICRKIKYKMREYITNLKRSLK